MSTGDQVSQYLKPGVKTPNPASTTNDSCYDLYLKPHTHGHMTCSMPPPTEHPVAGDPAEVVFARQPRGPAPWAGNCLQHAELGRQRAGQEAAGVRDSGDPLGDRQGGRQPQEAAVHRCSAHVPGERDGSGPHQALYLLSGSPCAMGRLTAVDIVLYLSN